MKFITLMLSFKTSCNTGLNVGVFFFNPRYEPFPAARHWCSRIGADAAAGFPAETIFREECVNNIKNVLSCCSPLQTFVEKDVFTNVVSLNASHKSNKLCISTDICGFIQLEWKESPSFPTTCSTMSVPILAILRQTVSLDKGTVFNVSADFFVQHGFGQYNSGGEQQVFSYGERFFGFSYEQTHQIRGLQGFGWCSGGFSHVVLGWLEVRKFPLKEVWWLTNMTSMFCSEMPLEMCWLHASVG